MAARNLTRLVLIGYGRIAPKHLEAFRALRCEFVACCNRSEAGRARAQSEGGIPRVYADIDDMLVAERPDGVVCTASLDQVYAAAMKILPHRIPTLLEKPPGTSLAEWRELCRLAEHYGTPVTVGLNRPYYGVLQKALADAGGVEAVTSVTLDWSEDPQHGLNRGLTRSQVHRLVFANSLHGLHLLTTLAGDLPDPQIVTRDLGEPFRRIMSLQGVSSRGTAAAFYSTWDAPAPWRLVFHARGRRYCLAPLESCTVQTYGQKELGTIEPDDVDCRFKPGFYRQSEAFLKMIATGRAEGPSQLAECGAAMQLAEALTARFSFQA